MTEERTQTDDRQGGSEAEGTKESESLDSLLNEFENGDDKAKEASPFAQTMRGLKPVIETVSRQQEEMKSLKPIAEFAKQAMVDRQEETLNKELDDALTFLKEPEETKGLTNTVARGLMEAYAIENKAFATAFQKRHDDPAGWKVALEQGRDWLKETVKTLPGNKVKDDLEAAHAAVAETDDEPTGDNDGPSAADMFNMSDAQFRAHKDNLRGQVRGSS